jgi:hypothetical protein
MPPTAWGTGRFDYERGRSMTTTSNRTIRPMLATPVQSVATIASAIFLLVGVLGFVPGITTHYGDLTFAGHESGAHLLGIFEVSILHNVVHLLFGAVGLAMARSAAGATSYLIGGGVVYLVLWVYGLVVHKGSAANFVPLNTADDWLHFVLGVAMVGAGVALRGRTRSRTGAL